MALQAPRAAIPLFLATLLVASSGCSVRTTVGTFEIDDCVDLVQAVIGPVFRARTPTARGADPPIDRFVGFQGLAPGGLGFAIAPRPLRVPFTIEVTGGILDPAAVSASVGVLFCMELDFRPGDGSTLANFWLLCGDVGAGGITAFASVDAVNLPGTQGFAGVFALDLQIEADGTEMIFRAREHDPLGAAPWTELDRTPYDGNPGPLFPSVGGSNLGVGAVAGFDLLRLVANGAPAGPQTPEEATLEAMWQAAQHELEVLYQLDGDPPEFAVALVEADAAIADLETALLEVEAIVDKKTRKKARKGIKKGRNKVRKARKKIEKQKPVEKAIRGIDKALAKQLKAFVELTSFSLEPAGP